VIFQNGGGEYLDMDKLAPCVIRPAVEAIGRPWYGWHGFRRGVVSNLYELGANEKIVQRILRTSPKSAISKHLIQQCGRDAVLAGDGDVPEKSPTIIQQMNGRARVKLLKTRRGEVAEWPNAAVC
jgi:hypothetical protein